MDNNYPYGNTFSQRDLSLPTNQKIPRSMQNSGTNLDECCEGHMGSGIDLTEIAGGSLPQSESGISLDEVVRRYDGK